MMRSTTAGKFLLNFLLPPVFWLGVWQILAMVVGQELLLPTPWRVMVVWGQLAATKTFWLSCLYSLLRIAAGYVLGVTAGILLGILCVWVPLANTLLSPVLRVVRAAPVASFIILALVWIKTDYLPIFIAFLMVLPLMFSATATAIRGVDGKLLEMAKVYRLRPGKVITKILLPGAAPTVLSQALTTLGLAWKSGVAAEVICLPKLALGKFLQNAKVYLETPEVFAWTATIIVLSLLLERVLKYAAGRLAKEAAL